LDRELQKNYSRLASRFHDVENQVAESENKLVKHVDMRENNMRQSYEKLVKKLENVRNDTGYSAGLVPKTY